MVGPVIRLLNWLANGVLRAIGVTPQEEVTSAFTRDEVAGLVEESRREGLLDEDDEHLVVGALKFEERDARAVLLTPDELETVGERVTPQQIEQLAASTGFSRFPVRRQDGGFSGYLHLKDALEFEERHRNRPVAPSWIRRLPVVAPDVRLRSVLATMQRTGAHLAVVADEDRTIGIVALEDVVEELVGEIRDEAGAQTPTRRP